MTGVKLAAIGALGALMASAIGDAATQVAMYAAGLAGIGYMWRRLVKPLLKLATVLEGLPEWCHGIDVRMAAVERRLSGKPPEPPLDP